MGGLCSKPNGNLDSNKNKKKKKEEDDEELKAYQNPVELQRGSVQKQNESMQPNEQFSLDDFYDGIPRYPSIKSRSLRSRQSAVAKVSEVSSRLGRAGTVGLEKAVEVLDALGSSMTNLNPNSGFASTVATKGNELAILAFEVANTIVKGSSLMHSLSVRNIIHLKENVLSAKGVQNLISKDTNELLHIVAADKREELKIFSGEVVRFGNRCKDPQWHNLDRYFEKIGRDLAPQRQLKEEAESVIELLMTLVQYTVELYHELQVLDRIEQEYQRKHQEDNSIVAGQKADSLASLRAELKSQKKQVRNLKKKSLWSRSLEEVMEKLVDIVHFLLFEIHNIFSDVDNAVVVEASMNSLQRLGPAGLSLHYANTIMQIDTLVARSSSIPPNTRDSLYQNLPLNIKSALRFKLQSFQVKEELTITEIKDEMEKTLQWLVPMSTNTANAHHGFGWVGEWANIGSDVNQKTAGPGDILRIETLYHADIEKTEAYILQLVLWLHHLVNKSNGACVNGKKVPTNSAIFVPLEKFNELPKHELPNVSPLTVEDQLLLKDVCKKKRIPGISKSQDFDSTTTRLIKHDRLSKSSNYFAKKESKGPIVIRRFPSVFPIIGSGIDKDKALDVIDRVEMFR